MSVAESGRIQNGTQEAMTVKAGMGCVALHVSTDSGSAMPILEGKAITAHGDREEPKCSPGILRQEPWVPLAN